GSGFGEWRFSDRRGCDERVQVTDQRFEVGAGGCDGPLRSQIRCAVDSRARIGQRAERLAQLMRKMRGLEQVVMRRFVRHDRLLRVEQRGKMMWKRDLRNTSARAAKGVCRTFDRIARR